ncbi:hypothetical protein OSB04_029322 [Centaurea solstitialis]|uniref:Myb/SANT-like domain-containing protein n=1 Tax=Centaurea solstitialis TaxID=347529 RepID=A0AA38SUA7_9ASTR|nr:hypothetical protein OSB04_029322 [Centaurea solstitialis]
MDGRVLRDALLRPHGLKVPRPGMTSHNRQYRNWTPNEETKLVDVLVNMTNTGAFKDDNGFKSGYLQYLEEALKVSLPSFGLWFIKMLLRWKNKTFPYYEDLCIVFGKDRAQGNRDRDFVEMEQEVNIEETQESDDDILDSSNAASRNTNLQNDETSPSVISRKRKSRSDDGFNNAVGLITESLKEISKDLSQGIKFDMKINELGEKIPSDIFKMTSLTQTEKFKALTKIRGDSVNIQNFWQMEEVHRETWVK